ncbi:AAA family ATPase [Streptomyces acidiscabies]|uniref:AAA family ATPase n=1 Tax=Streptomyces acidiscabies TaxID=42234 RepID=A0AAP6BJP0_9ACTN|nr:AAA family ATPase [Streptomyces acidiscabies]MBP5936675.1 ATP-binding protein [Streptomyces sp. LBUM 1476]MBZ3915328.1 AAA family ATPase [Streptomyces acidiscabies]MDX2966014.1 AAA family ATPase [Streptomyces acidiscabies]MDX3025007.1 AAA family ATPase [Streptomyces acidiscabies]MDX3795306.1 AAA family ATPase [Streptomyces acidiscabies]
MNRTTAYATALPAQPTAPARESRAGHPAPVVRDLRDREGHSPHALLFGPRDLVVVTGLPGSGKSTLMRRTVHGAGIDSQDTRDRWDARTPAWLPYAVYRPLVRLAHYAGLWRALRSGKGVVVHDCGTQSWVRNWLARASRRRGGTLHLLLLDVTPDTALEGQRERGRGVSRYAFLRHRHAASRLIRSVEKGNLPDGCEAAILLDRPAADVLRRIAFTRG